MNLGRFRPFARFLLGGGFNTAVTWVLFVVLARLMAPTGAYTLTYLFGIGLGYVINSRYVFDADLGLHTAWRYPLVYLVQYAYGLTAVCVLVERLGFSKEGVIVFVTISSLPITFVLTRTVLTARGVR